MRWGGGSRLRGQGGRRTHRPVTAPLGMCSSAAAVELGCVTGRIQSEETSVPSNRGKEREIHSGPEKASAEENQGLELLKKLI